MKAPDVSTETCFHLDLLQMNSDTHIARSFVCGREREIPMTNNIDPLTVLATDADVAGWMNEASQFC